MVGTVTKAVDLRLVYPCDCDGRKVCVACFIMNSMTLHSGALYVRSVSRTLTVNRALDDAIYLEVVTR